MKPKSHEEHRRHEFPHTLTLVQIVEVPQADDTALTNPDQVYALEPVARLTSSIRSSSCPASRVTS